MINSKQRAYLRGLANREPALYQVGKDGINDNMVALFEFIIERVEIIDFSDLSESDSYDLGHLFHPFICRTPGAARRTYG